MKSSTQRERLFKSEPTLLHPSDPRYLVVFCAMAAVPTVAALVSLFDLPTQIAAKAVFIFVVAVPIALSFFSRDGHPPLDEQPTGRLDQEPPGGGSVDQPESMSKAKKSNAFHERVPYKIKPLRPIKFIKGDKLQKDDQQGH